MGKTLTQKEIERYVKGATEAGFAVGAIEIKADGTVRLEPKSVDATPKPKSQQLKTW